MTDIYTGSSTIAGELPKEARVTYKNCLNRRDKFTLLLFAILIFLTGTALIWTIVNTLAFSSINLLLITSLGLVIIIEVIKFLQSITLLIFARHAKDPVPMQPGKNMRIAVLTTIVPGKEPFELVARTLKKMKTINPGEGNMIDVWLLDEGNDQWVRSKCHEMGVKHFSRKGVPQWNTDSGTFKAKTKHGNHNAWRSAYENFYDIVAQMDPDHIPRKNFLIRTLGYFSDPDVAFVVAPQVYGNLRDSWIAKGAAFQAYLFHGIIQRGGNGMSAPLLIGTNHLYRTKAFRQINGYQDSIIEDHLTSMVIYASKNDDGNHWKGVYTPDVIAVGEGPTSFTDYFNQQKRWAYGIWEIASNSTPSIIKKMARGQALSFLMLQFFYPSVAISWVASFIATILFSMVATDYSTLGPILLTLWIYSTVSSLALFYWLRKFNLVEHERKDWGLEGISLLLMCIPVYVSAAWEALTRKPLTYAVTAKGNLTSPDTMQTFTPHINWITVNLLALVLIYPFINSPFSSSVIWTVEHIIVCALPIIIFAISRIKPLRSQKKRTKRPTIFHKTKLSKPIF